MSAEDLGRGGDRLRRLRSVADRVLRDGEVVARSDASVHRIFPIATSANEAEALRAWVLREGARRTIEIGLAYGISALFVCDALLQTGAEDARHVVLDPHQSTRFKGCGLQVLEEAGVLELVEHHAEESQLALPRFVSEGRSFDLAFVDGSHLFDRVFLDLIYLGRLVKPGNVIFLDDYQVPAVARAVSFCVTNLGWKLEEVSAPDEHHQWAVLRTVRELLARSSPHFVPF